jgi:hypothetical protein
MIAGMGARLRSPLRRVIAAAVLCGAVVVTPVPAGAEVTTGDIDRARVEADEARARLAAARVELDDALRRRDVIVASLERTAERVAAAGRELRIGEEAARERIARMYMAAGTVDSGLRPFTDPSDLTTHAVYLGAVFQQDREEITRIIAARHDLERLEERVAEQLADQDREVERLEGVVAERLEEVAAADAVVGDVESAWQAQEEARRRAEEEARRRAEEERRRQEEEERRRQEEEDRRRQEAQDAIDDAKAAAEALGYEPGAGAGQWRWLVAEYFPERLVDEAVSVMACESHGDPFAVNPFSGAAGLFQHMPPYWPPRAANSGWAGASVFHPEANIAASAWLVLASERAGHDSWAHWSCKP